MLANVWDAATARLVESQGARALATTSAGVAWSHGYADGDLLPVPLLAATVADIVRVAHVPVSADVEGGYSSDPAAAADAVGTVVRAGAVGINIEDGTGPPELLAAKIERIRRASRDHALDVFVNARTDVFLRSLVPEARRLEETLARAERYRAAGADGIFVPGLTDAAAIRTLTAAVPLPVNVLARPGLPAAAELAALGVRRLSAGAWLAESAFALVAARAAAFLRTGESGPVAEGAMPYPELNALLARS